MIKYRTFDFKGNQQFDLEVPAGIYKGFGLALEFDNATGQTLTPSQLGQLRLFYRGERKWEISIDNLMGIVRRLFPGTQRLSSSAGAAGEIFAYVPLQFGDGNVCAIGGDDWYFQFSHSDLSSTLDSGNMTVMLQPGFGLQRYMPIYQDYSIRTLSAESKPERFIKRNLAVVSVAYSANHTNFRLDKDNNTIYDATDEEMEFVTNMEQVHDTYGAAAASSATAIQNPWILNLYKDRNLAEVWSKPDTTYGFGVVSSDASVSGATIEFEPTPLQFELTAARVSARLQKVDQAAAKLSA